MIESLLLPSPFHLHVEIPLTVAVACSGGRDSMALLHATVVQVLKSIAGPPQDDLTPLGGLARSGRFGGTVKSIAGPPQDDLTPLGGLARSGRFGGSAVFPLKRKVVVLHVHHGLNPQADAWLSHVQQQCESWAAQGFPVFFEAHRLQSAPSPGLSIEAWARQQRYAALSEMALKHGAACVLLAHHRQDQAETFLLQALRGAGLNGLSAMPKVAERAGVMWLRPWLDVASAEIAAYVKTHGLAHIEDGSNADVRFARNRLRHEIWPLLTRAFDQATLSLAQSAQWAQEAVQCLSELAALDLGQMTCADGLRIKPWLDLSKPRRSNALRAWLLQQTDQPARTTLVQRLMHELPYLDVGRWPDAGGELRLYRGVLCYEINRYSAIVKMPIDSRSHLTGALEETLNIHGPGNYELPQWGGILNVLTVEQDGVALAKLQTLQCRSRQGGERFQSGPNRPPRCLKKQYQAAHIPAWARHGPLIFNQDHELIFVPGLGLDARYLAARGEPQVGFLWQEF